MTAEKSVRALDSLQCSHLNCNFAATGSSRTMHCAHLGATFLEAASSHLRKRLWSAAATNSVSRKCSSLSLLQPSLAQRYVAEVPGVLPTWLSPETHRLQNRFDPSVVQALLGCSPATSLLKALVGRILWQPSQNIIRAHSLSDDSDSESAHAFDGFSEAEPATSLSAFCDSASLRWHALQYSVESSSSNSV